MPSNSLGSAMKHKMTPIDITACPPLQPGQSSATFYRSWDTALRRYFSSIEPLFMRERGRACRQTR